MAALLKPVQPGDLITAQWMNDLVDTVRDLSARVADLEGNLMNGSAVTITDLIFISPLRLGAQLEIRGRNFGYSRGTQQVRFDNVNITEFRPGSDDTRLLVTVPSFVNFPEDGDDVTLFVGNGVSSTTRILHILPADRPISGNLVDVIWETITPNPFGPKDSPRVGYRLRSRVGVARTFTITTTVSPPELQTGIELRDENDVLITNRQIRLESLQEKLFFIKLPTIPDSLVKGTVVTITMIAVSGGVTGSDSRDFTVGEKKIPSDPNLTLSFSSFNAVDDAGDPLPPEDGLYDTATNTVKLKPGNLGRMELELTFEQKGTDSVVGTYNVILSPLGVVDGWTRSLVTATSIMIEENDLVSGKANRPIRFNLEAVATATASQEAVRVQRVGATTDERMGFRLILLP